MGVMALTPVDRPVACSTSAGFRFVVAGGWHSALSGVLASIVFVAIVFVLTNDPQFEGRRHERAPSLRILFVAFFVFLVAAFLWATVAGFPERVALGTGRSVGSAVQPVLAVPAAWLLSEGVVLLFFAIAWLVSAYEDRHEHSSGVAATAVRCFRLIAWLTAVEVWIAIETATRSLAGRGWWYSQTGVTVVALLAVPFLLADRVAARLGRPGRVGARDDGRALGRALGFVGVSAALLVVFFALVTGQPDSSLLHEGNWCGQGLPWWAAAAALAPMALFLGTVAALARTLPEDAPPAA